MKENQSILPDSAGTSHENQLLYLPFSNRPKVYIIISLGLLLVFLLAIVGYLAYQNNGLKSQVLQQLPPTSTSTTESTPITGPKATATPAIEQESTKNLIFGPLPNKTLTDWKTYEDPMLGFGFNNPNGYILTLDKQSSNPGRSKLILYEPSVHEILEKEGRVGDELGIYISVYEETEKVPLMDRAKEIVYDSFFGQVNGDYEITQIQGVEAIKYADNENVSYYLYVDNHLLIFANNGAPLADFEKLISTVYLP